MMHLRYASGIALVAALVFAGAAPAQETMKHSGSVVSVDEHAARLVIDEVGPWRLHDGKTVLTTLRITVTPDTEFAMLSPAPSEWKGEFGELVETPISAWAVYPGDFVTIDCRHEGRRLIATKITVSYVPTQ